MTAYVSGKPLKLKIDSGAKCNVISAATLQSSQIPYNINKAEKVTLVSYSNTNMKTLSRCELNCVISNEDVVLKFHIIDDRAKTILGLPDAMKLQLMRLHMKVHEIKTKKGLSSHK